MHITLENYKIAAPCRVETASARLAAAGAPYTRGAHGTRLYHVADSLPTLKPRELKTGAAARLVAAATQPDDVLYVDASNLPRTRRLAEWMGSHETRRFRSIQAAFVLNLSHSRLCTPGSAIMESMIPLGQLLLLCPPVLTHVFTGGPAPDMYALSVPFAIVNTVDFNSVDNNMEAA